MPKQIHSSTQCLSTLFVCLLMLLQTNFALAQIDLELSLSVNDQSLEIYTNRTFTLEIANKGSTNASGIRVNIPLPNGLVLTSQDATQGTYYDWNGDWMFSNLNAGQTATLQLVLYTLTESNPITVFAQIMEANQSDNDSTPANGTCCTANEDDEAAATIGGSDGGNGGGNGGGNNGGNDDTNTDLELNLVVSANTYNIFENVTYSLSLRNTSGVNANDVSIDFPLPNGLVFASQDLSQGDYFNWEGVWKVGTIAAGQNASMELELYTVVEGQDITSYAQVVTANPNDSDSNPGNGTCCNSSEDDEAAITITPASGNGGGGNDDDDDDDGDDDDDDDDDNGNGGGTNPTDMVDYTAQDQVTPYTGLFRPGINMGYFPPFQDEELAALAAGDPEQGINGVGAKAIRPGLFEIVTEIYGYDIRVDAFDYYQELGMDDMTMIVGFPVDWHRDLTDYCGDGEYSAMFGNLYTDIWDGGANGTPYNDDNYYAAYLYQVVSTYKDHIKFWEIWNEPGFDLTGQLGWREPGDPFGNWWDQDPDPCESILRAPIQHYIRTLRISWEIIKTLAPDDYVVVAGVGFESYLDAVLRNTDNPNGGAITTDFPLRGGAYFDVMGFHTYPDIDGSVREWNPAINDFSFFRHSDKAAKGVSRRQNNYQAVLDNYGFDGVTYPKKEWIITEFNVPRQKFRPDAMGSIELQRNYIIKATVEASKNNIRQIHAYNLGDKRPESQAVGEFDLLGFYKYLPSDYPDDVEMLPVGTAYKTVADLIFGTTYDAARTAQMNLPSNIDGGAYRKPNGQYIYILWAVTMTDQSEVANATYSFPAVIGLNQLYRKEWNYSMTGQTNVISTQNIALTGSPIFLTQTPEASVAQNSLVIFNNATHLSVKGVFPNPAIDYVDLMVQSVEVMPVTIDIYDAMGTLQISKNTELTRGFNTVKFDTSDLPTGMYHIHIQGSTRKGTLVKFIKTKI